MAFNPEIRESNRMKFGNKSRTLLWFALLTSLFAVPAKALGTQAGASLTGQVTIGAAPASEAVVWVRTSPAQTPRAKPVEHSIRQERLRFDPEFSAVPVGTLVRFENLDPEIHNVKSESRDNRFDVGAHLPGTVKEVVLKKPGPVPLRCKTHPEMRGMIYVSPSPHFAVTDENGRYEIQGLPPGTHQVEVWHPRLQPDEADRAKQRIAMRPGVVRHDIALVAKAPAGTDLSGLALRNWTPLIEDIEKSLDDALLRWKAGRKSTATLKVMTTLSRLYAESGLRGVISERFGSNRASFHEMRFDQIRKDVQTSPTSSETEARMRRKISLLISELARDAERLNTPP